MKVKIKIGIIIVFNGGVIMLNQMLTMSGGAVGAYVTTRVVFPYIIRDVQAEIDQNSDISVKLKHLTLKNLTKATVSPDKEPLKKIISSVIVACAKTCAAVCLGSLFGSCIAQMLLQQK